MPDLSPISEAAIRQLAGEQSFQRALPYVHDGALSAQRREGDTLKARCQGSRDEAYRVWATLSDGGVREAECSCPVGLGGRCKHVAALLLTWRDDPAAFAPVEATDAGLARRSKDDLIALVKQMLRQEPDLELLLATPLPGAAAGPVNPESYRRQARAAFRHGGDGWGAEAGIAHELLATLAIGDGFAARAEWPHAAAVYLAVSETTLEHFGEYDNENGELIEVVQDCVSGLARCLEAERDPAAREALLQALFDVYRYDTDYGGVSLADDVPDAILAHATPAERELVAGWVRAALPEGEGLSQDWQRQAYGGFLIELGEGEPGGLDDERFLQICRETGRTGDLVERLLTLARVDEAADAARAAGDYQLLQLADVFVEHEHGPLAEELVRERAARSQDTRLPAWLRRRYEARGDTAAALEMALQVYRQRPAIERYREVRRLARPLGRWEALRQELLALPLPSGPQLRVRIYLDEGEIDAALAALREVEADRFAHGASRGLALEVAQAAEAERPRAAIEVERRHVAELIDQRSRGSYQEACRWLLRLRDLYARLDEQAVWERYIADLREAHRRLPALKQALAAAKL